MNVTRRSVHRLGQVADDVQIFPDGDGIAHRRNIPGRCGGWTVSACVRDERGQGPRLCMDRGAGAPLAPRRWTQLEWSPEPGYTRP